MYQKRYIYKKKSHQQVRKNDNIVTHNNEKNVPIPKSYNVSDIDKIVCFENHIGENNCLINCILRALAILVELVPNYTYQSENPMINAFMKYVKDIKYINNGTILYANEGSIQIGQNSQPLSVKHLFLIIIKK